MANIYTGKTLDTPRPTADAFPSLHPRELASRQAQCDAAEQQRHNINAATARLTAEREARDAADQAARAAVMADQRAKTDEATLGPARTAYLANGGTAEGWEQVKPTLLEERRVAAARRQMPADAPSPLAPSRITG